ncbi:LysR family transcriptional regulator [Enterobacter sp. Cy-643]|uniref:LysR family transcriptional regulator n=1 Tax=Enterobacter sp. Cy-643 TaxID=2608346 RepID=UPI001420ABB2|nr:LysR family transcriptional regulator [Enterobacter sp. Cy-643]
MDPTELDGIAVFLAVAEHQGFRSAARSLGLTASAVSQQVSRLEKRIGAPLFSRTTRSVGLTEAGQRLFEHAKPAAGMFLAGLDSARELGEQPGGNLRINTTRASLPLLINRLLPGFHEQYPNIRLELRAEDEFIDIVEGGFDAGIRLGHVVERDMVAVWLTPPDEYLVVCAPSLLARYGRPKNIEELQKLPALLISRHNQAVNSWELTQQGRPVKVKVDGPLILNDPLSLIQAALRGTGMIYTVRSLVSRYLAQGQLEIVLENSARSVPGLNIYYPGRHQSLPKLRALVSYATAHLRNGISADDFLAEQPGSEPGDDNQPGI